MRSFFEVSPRDSCKSPARMQDAERDIESRMRSLACSDDIEDCTVDAMRELSNLRTDNCGEIVSRLRAMRRWDERVDNAICERIPAYPSLINAIERNPACIDRIVRAESVRADIRSRAISMSDACVQSAFIGILAACLRSSTSLNALAASAFELIERGCGVRFDYDESETVRVRKAAMPHLVYAVCTEHSESYISLAIACGFFRDMADCMDAYAECRSVGAWAEVCELARMSTRRQRTLLVANRWVRFFPGLWELACFPTAEERARLAESALLDLCDQGESDAGEEAEAEADAKAPKSPVSVAALLSEQHAAQAAQACDCDALLELTLACIRPILSHSAWRQFGGACGVACEEPSADQCGRICAILFGRIAKMAPGSYTRLLEEALNTCVREMERPDATCAERMLQSVSIACLCAMFHGAPVPDYWAPRLRGISNPVVLLRVMQIDAIACVIDRRFWSCSRAFLRLANMLCADNRFELAAKVLSFGISTAQIEPSAAEDVFGMCAKAIAEWGGGDAHSRRAAELAWDALARRASLMSVAAPSAFAHTWSLNISPLLRCAMSNCRTGGHVPPEVLAWVADRCDGSTPDILEELVKNSSPETIERLARMRPALFTGPAQLAFGRVRCARSPSARRLSASPQMALAAQRLRAIEQEHAARRTLVPWPAVVAAGAVLATISIVDVRARFDMSGCEMDGHFDPEEHARMAERLSAYDREIHRMSLRQTVTAMDALFPTLVSFLQTKGVDARADEIKDAALRLIRGQDVMGLRLADISKFMSDGGRPA